ncbi:MAG: helix-turn-helix domain-containing protein [Brevefilum sp.]
MATLGQKLRELRHQKGYKLNEVAEGADLSISFISLIERDKASISVENLNKLANFYHVRLFQIFQDIEEEDAYIVRDEQRDELDSYGSSAEPTLFLLSPEDNLSFKAILARIPPASQQENIQLQKGETFILVKQGQLEIEIPNKKPVTLKEGDSAHLTSFKGTLLKNKSNATPVKLLIVASATTQQLDKQGNLLSYLEVTE